MSARLVVRATLVAAVLAVGGCSVDPYCIECSSMDAGPGTDARAADGARPDAREHDGGPPDDAVTVDAPTGEDAGCLARELCNDLDDDCDGRVDEEIDTLTDEENCGGCGRVCAPPAAFGECVAGACTIGECDVGYYDRDGNAANGCEVRCIPVATEEARCDLRDDDCDGSVDETYDTTTDVNNCGACGRVCRFAHASASCAAGVCTLDACDAGFFDGDGVSTNGCEYPCTPSGPETCNLRDDDCDYRVDEGDPGGGGSCGTDTGECELGVEHCVGGGIACTGGVSADTETCNGRDDDCDGSMDEGNPEAGRYCGASEGACEPGREQCSGGRLVCVGAVGPGTERCNTIDDDCDAMIDEGNPDGGASCGTDTGACTAGMLRCVSGALSCMGTVGPMLESCNTVDDDCDTRTDEGFDLTRDPANCGMCGRVCTAPNAISRCTSSTCAFTCLDGFFDRDGMASNGCEVMCDFTGSEVCNGRDDDCDGSIDETLTVPSTFCNPNGVCAGTTARCAGGSGWVCDYPVATYQADETRCDGLDNDCDGRADEPFPLVGTSCNNGDDGACFRVGMVRCNAAGTGTECSAPTGIVGTTEACNGVDDDCDGTVDDGAPATWVQFSGPFGPSGATRNRWIFAYEASRPDATTTSAGSTSHRVCSERGRMPWTQVTYQQAQDACATIGARLCTEAEWQRACQTSASTACRWSYGGSCTTYQPQMCNGNDYDPDGVIPPDDVDAVRTTGSLPMCYADWSAGDVFDLSGNVEEWTQTRGGGVNPIRGGSFNDASGGMECGFSFVAGSDTIQLPTVGFRCCRATAP